MTNFQAFFNTFAPVNRRLAIDNAVAGVSSVKKNEEDSAEGKEKCLKIAENYNKENKNFQETEKDSKRECKREGR